ncbi:MAG: 2-phospho-L-lactate transferase [Candidatus Promineifilaceae bacterium]
MPTKTHSDTQLRQLKSRLESLKIVLLVGGVGGAKLADGFAQLVAPEDLTIIVNTGDDFSHMGLYISPDMDTVLYTLAGVANPDTGWGRIGESWRTMEEVGRLGGPDWFRLGDLDLATHLTRSHLLANGRTLTEATEQLSRYLGVTTTILPMSNDPAPTMIETEEGILPFQNWFVARQWQPVVKKIHLPEDVRATPQVTAALQKADYVAIAPSNPFVSINPILNVYPIREMVNDIPEMVIAVSPIIGGRAVKGPAAKMMVEMGMNVSPEAVADYYGELLDLFVYDKRDPRLTRDSHPTFLQLDTLMNNRADRLTLAANILQYALDWSFE